jgi:hypoxanthine phosphoribosyltransferase
MNVFLSHPSHLKPLLRELRSKFPRFLDAWIDEDSLCFGDNLERSIRDTIRSGSDFVLIFLDKQALSSPWVQRELQWALERERHISRTFLLPILVEAIPSDTLPDTIRGRLYLRLLDYKRASVEALASQITEHLFHLVVRGFDSQDHDKPSYTENAVELADILIANQFLPDVIIGIARGGLYLAALLSKKIKTDRLIPVVSLWPRNDYNNSFNHINFTREDLAVGPDDTVKILIVDDICKKGITLLNAKRYVMNSIDMPGAEIKTAVMSYYERELELSDGPTFWVNKPKGPINDFGGDTEPYDP